MGFKVLLSCRQNELTNQFKEGFGQKGFELVLLEQRFTAGDSLAELCDLCADMAPCAIVNYLDVEISSADVELTQCLSRIGNDYHIPLVQFSHFDVFDGAALDHTFDEASELASVSPRAQMLAEAEKFVGALDKHVILRRSWMMDCVTDSLLGRFIPALLGGASPRISDHAFGNPIYSAYAVSTAIAVVQQILCGAENWGVFHLRSSDSCSEAEFGDALVRILQSDFECDVTVPSVTGVDDNRRFLEGNAHFGGDRLTRNFGIQSVSWRKGFKAAVQTYLDKHEEKLGAKS